MTEDTETTPYSLYLDLIEGELGNALVDVYRLRSLERQKEAARDRCLMLLAALDNCLIFLRKLEPSLDGRLQAVLRAGWSLRQLQNP
jgi:hypothetical protein